MSASSETPRGRRRRTLALMVTLVSSCAALPAFAQAPPRQAQPQGPRPGAPAQRPSPVTPGNKPTPEAASAGGNTEGTAAALDVKTAQDVRDLTEVQAGGLTAAQVAERAAQTSFAAKASLEAVTGAERRVDAAKVGWAPRLALTARYTRLSSLTPPSIGGDAPGGFVASTDPAGTVNSQNTVVLDPSIFRFPIFLNNYLLPAQITVPISDYFLRIGQSYSAATKSEEAARYDLSAARAKSYSDGKVAYYVWLRGRGAVIVTAQTLAVAEAHLKDAENQFAVGNASKADVLRAQTQLAASQLQLERAKSVALQAERQVRVAMHAKDEEKLVPGDILDGSLPPVPANVRQFIDEALAQRAEIKSIDKNAESARKQAEVARAGRYPVISGFAEATYANPNQRLVPQRQEWFPTWSAGAQLTWTPNDIFTAGAQGSELESRAQQLEAQKGTIRDGIELEVVQAYQQVVEADAALQTTTRQLESAIEGYRVARELFNNGRGTGTTVIDAENALAQTRFDYLNARVDTRLSRVRLEHATGRDLKSTGAP